MVAVTEVPSDVATCACAIFAPLAIFSIEYFSNFSDALPFSYNNATVPSFNSDIQEY